MKSNDRLLIGSICFAAALATAYAEELPPQAVMKKFGEFKASPNATLGAKLRHCSKAERQVFEVSESGGFTGTTIIFDQQGNQLYQENWSDTGTGTSEGEKIDLRTFNCKDAEPQG